LDVGQGDSILIRTPQETVLIDSGDIPMRDKMMAQLEKEKITTLDKVIITHPHADHLGGMPRILQKIKVKQIYDCGFVFTSNLYNQYLTMVKKEKIPFKVVKDGDIIDLGDGITLHVLSPRQPLFENTKSDPNNNSIVAKLVYQNFSMLFTGDAEKESEEQLVKRHGQELKSDILKSPHHGSNTSSTLPFLKEVSPKAVIISLSADNPYHFPHPNTMRKYKDLKIATYRTDTDGTVTITSDGKSYKIAKEK
jgi:competence protein ComEC